MRWCQHGVPRAAQGHVLCSSAQGLETLEVLLEKHGQPRLSVAAPSQCLVSSHEGTEQRNPS